jgi:hypothetical protein
VSDDIATRLIHEADHAECSAFVEHEILREAADEIERLRNRLEKFERAAWELSMNGVFTDTALGRKALDTYSEAVRGE